MSASLDDGGSAAARQRGSAERGLWGVNKRTNRHKPRSLDAVDVVVVVISSTYEKGSVDRAVMHPEDLNYSSRGEAAGSPLAPLWRRVAPTSHMKAPMKRAVACALLLGTTSDALSLTTVRHRHACSSSSVAMGLFDGLKKVCHASLLPPRAGDRSQQRIRHQRHPNWHHHHNRIIHD